MELNYSLIGKRIQQTRKSKGLSQEKLAEMTQLSSAHIGHIERASSKLSVAALVGIANALDVSPDMLLSDVIHQSKTYLVDDFAELIDDCNSSELYLILQLTKSAKQAMRDKRMT